MTDPGTHRDRAAHRAEHDGRRNKPLLWAALAAVAVLLIIGAGFLLPWNGQDTAGTEKAGDGTSSGTANAAAEDPVVVVAHTKTRANTWSGVLGDPAVELGRPSEDAGTKALISRALREAQDDQKLRTTTDESFKLRARTEGDAGPVLDAQQRLQNLEQRPSPTSTPPATPDTATFAAAAGAASGGPQPTATVVSRAQWDEYRSQHPDTTLVASTPGGRPDGDFLTADDAELQSSLAEWAHLAEPFHALAAIDISGSMGEPVAPDGTTRMDLTVGAATMAVKLFPEHDALGVWEFSRNLDGDKDYREVTPIEEMSAEDGGITQRDRLMQDAESLRYIPKGYTGLYDTTLAAYRKVLHDDAPGSLKTVILLTDGIDQDPDSIGLDNLLKALKDEQDPDNPVRIITVGISQDADEAVLRQIADATGGSAHIARTPQDIQKVFVRALTGE